MVTGHAQGGIWQNDTDRRGVLFSLPILVVKATLHNYCAREGGGKCLLKSGP